MRLNFFNPPITIHTVENSNEFFFYSIKFNYNVRKCQMLGENWQKYECGCVRAHVDACENHTEEICVCAYRYFAFSSQLNKPFQIQRGPKFEQMSRFASLCKRFLCYAQCLHVYKIFETKLLEMNERKAQFDSILIIG